MKQSPSLFLACVMLLGFAAQPHGQAPSPPTEALTGLGPIYNAQSCRECHQTPVIGAASQAMEVRVGHLLPGQFQNPAIPIDDGNGFVRTAEV